MLERGRIRRARLISVMVLVYAVCCLPFSLKTSLSLWFPLFNQSIFNHPAMLALLYILCASQFSLNFIVYTIVPSQLREAHKNLWTTLLGRINRGMQFISNKFHYRRIIRNSVDSGQISVDSSKSKFLDNIEISKSSHTIYEELKRSVSNCWINSKRNLWTLFGWSFVPDWSKIFCCYQSLRLSRYLLFT